MLKRLRTDERGFGLIELIIAMAILNVGLLALVAAFNSGALAIKHASRMATASVIADRQMEIYRGIKYSEIGLVASLVTTANGNALYLAGWPSGTMSGTPATDCLDTAKPECKPMQTVTGPDGRSYRIDTYIVLTDLAESTMRDVKLVRVVVRDGAELTRVLVRQTSTFDESLGL